MLSISAVVVGVNRLQEAPLGAVCVVLPDGRIRRILFAAASCLS